MTAEKVIEISHLTYRYPDGTPGLNDVSLDIYRHESVAILGPNGAGKSTLLYHLNGTLLGNGSIRVLGMTVQKSNFKEIRRKVGMVFQNPEDQLFCSTVFDDVAFGPLNMDLSEEEIRKRVERALEMVGLSGFGSRSAHHLSEGEKKRVALATVLAMDSEILAFDEPTDNLDPIGSRMLIERIRSFPQTKIIVTHHLALVSHLCERSVLMREGMKIGDLPTRELLENRDLLEQLGFDLDFARWMAGRMKGSNSR